MIGGAGSDKITGGAAHEQLFGEGGDDTHPRRRRQRHDLRRRGQGPALAATTASTASTAATATTASTAATAPPRRCAAAPARTRPGPTRPTSPSTARRRTPPRLKSAGQEAAPVAVETVTAHGDRPRHRQGHEQGPLRRHPRLPGRADRPPPAGRHRATSWPSTRSASPTATRWTGHAAARRAPDRPRARHRPRPGRLVERHRPARQVGRAEPEPPARAVPLGRLQRRRQPRPRQPPAPELAPHAVQARPARRRRLAPEPEQPEARRRSRRSSRSRRARTSASAASRRSRRGLRSPSRCSGAAP